MSVSAFPALIDALMAQSGALLPAGALPFDGMPTTDDDVDFVAFGIPSIDDAGQAFAGTSEQLWGPVGNLSKDEQGAINCVAAARSTDETVKSARDRAFAIAEAVASLCRTVHPVTNAPNLGVATVLWVSYGGQTSAYQVVEAGQPVGYAVEFQIGYRARI